VAEQPIIVKKKIIQGHAHHGGSWKVAYADFVTAMMAFFLVMWLLSMSDEVRDKIQGYFNDPLGFTNATPKSKVILTMEGSTKPKPSVTATKGKNGNPFTGEQRTLEAVKDKISRLLTETSMKDLAKDIRLSMTREGLLIQFIEAKGAVFFESGSSQIRPEALKVVAKIAPVLTASKHLMEIQGHTDAQPFGGKINGNWALSNERALTLQEALETDQVPDSQFSGVRAFAATHLLDPAHPLSYMNRRVTILLPREYTSDSLPIKPGDQLSSEVAAANTPEAVMVKPTGPDLLSSQSRFH
jgi:chemotaxis protein MotB